MVATPINHVNRFMATGWKVENRKFENDSFGRIPQEAQATIYITFVDKAKARFDIANILKTMGNRGNYREYPKYWLDFDNSPDRGQVILSSIGEIRQPDSEKYDTVGYLPFVTDELGELLNQAGPSDDTPSCSLAGALEKQDLYINAALPQMGRSLLWNLFRNSRTFHRDFFVNLKDCCSQPLGLL